MLHKFGALVLQVLLLANANASPKQAPLVLQGSIESRFTTLTNPEISDYAVHVSVRQQSEAQGLDWCQDNVKKFTGYFESPQGFFFFAFFESRDDPRHDPFMLWINGGPGCSSNLGLFMELGPCRVDPGGNSTSFNPHAWNTKANLLFLDQPVGVGFSYEKPGHVVGDTETAATEVDIFFQLLFYNLPEYSRSPVHLFGESYGGHYIPAIGRKIFRENKAAPTKNPNRIHINLASLGIGNGWVRPYIQYEQFAEFLIDEKYGPFITPEQYKFLKQSYQVCEFLARQCERFPSRFSCVPAATYCERVFAFPESVKRNPYDVRQECDSEDGECYAIQGDIDAYLNRGWVQDLLGVEREYVGCSEAVGEAFNRAGDEDLRFDTAVAEVLEGGVKVLVYAGDADYVCNWMGNEAWLDAMEWSGQDGYLDAPEDAWLVGGVEAGTVKSFGNLTWIKIYEAGHMVPYDRPVESLKMVLDWMK
ncbi:hypothetical protein HDU98_005864 [Podochytrium sp. JEL0797]|nr:hypothetical protein HDU98_005864 [Podochytrium sp. JEL0797]